MSSDYIIGNYTVTDKSTLSALQAAGITSDDKLKQVDLNGDNKISEDELVEFAEELDSEETNSANNNTRLNQSQEELLEEQLDIIYSQIAYIEEHIDKLGEQLNQANNMICNGQSSAQETDQAVQNAFNLRNQISQQRSQVYSLLVQAENAVQNAQRLAASNASYGGAVTGTGMNTITVPTSADASGVANYALQFDGKSAGEMQSIMQGAGCAFHSGAWCADFVTFITKQVYGNNTPGDYANSCSNTAYCPTIGNWASERGLLTTDSSQVQPGDFILYGSPGSFYHIGLVTSVNADGTVNTIEGNTSDDNGNYTNGVVNQHSNRTGYYVLMHRA